MKTQHNIYIGLEITSIIIGVIIIIASFIPGVMAVTHTATFNFDVADFFIYTFLAGAAVMVGGAMLCEYLDD